MAIRFIHPWLLLLLPLAVYPLYLWYRDNRHMALFRRRLIYSLRFLLLLCLILALAGTQINYRVNKQSVVFVVDLSASCEKEKTKAESFIREALKHKKPEDKAAIVVYGGNTRVDQAMGTSSFSRLESVVEKDYSNVEEALKLAGAILPGDTRRRIVLLSDGRENDGDARRETEMLSRRQVRLDAWPLESQAGTMSVLTACARPPGCLRASA
ncbi:vWA domain-containing protein [Syntrophomonas palmitatica]|uniref:vWA domain-containing protein n=1 Tax=Syntrophomonas palmitatica TaxID=402877 RepID=UPI0006CFC0F6|nr:vWA domain-containing protein [Syntrophomonas palmitatica]